MSFRSRFPTVARLLSGAAAVDTDDQRRDDDSEIEEPADGDDGGDEGQGQGDDGGEGTGGDGGSEAAASLADLDPEDRTLLENAFERDATALVQRERDRCIAVFTSDAGRRSPNAAAKLLRRTGMASADVIDTLGDVGADSRGNGRQRLQGDSSTRESTGRPPAEQSTASSAAKETQKKRRQERNKALAEKGGVKANRSEFGDD